MSNITFYFINKIMKNIFYKKQFVLNNKNVQINRKTSVYTGDKFLNKHKAENIELERKH